ncbi:hypothetical protein B0H13DRAFT_1873022 [Mycena leptocephala]|nr:hypothetical protein B0H13DRAFT_1873022 [Mycena leptocephala]
MPHDAEARSKHSPAEQESLDGVSARRLMDFQGDHGTSRNHQYFVGCISLITSTKICSRGRWQDRADDPTPTKTLWYEDFYLSPKYLLIVPWPTLKIVIQGRLLMCRDSPHARYIPSRCVGSEPMCSGLHGMYRVWNAAMDELQFSLLFWDGSSEAQRRQQAHGSLAPAADVMSSFAFPRIRFRFFLNHGSAVPQSHEFWPPEAAFTSSCAWGSSTLFRFASWHTTARFFLGTRLVGLRAVLPAAITTATEHAVGRPRGTENDFVSRGFFSMMATGIKHYLEEFAKRTTNSTLNRWMTEEQMIDEVCEGSIIGAVSATPLARQATWNPNFEGAAVSIMSGAREWGVRPVLAGTLLESDIGTMWHVEQIGSANPTFIMKPITGNNSLVVDVVNGLSRRKSVSSGLCVQLEHTTEIVDLRQCSGAPSETFDFLTTAVVLLKPCWNSGDWQPKKAIAKLVEVRMADDEGHGFLNLALNLLARQEAKACNFPRRMYVIGLKPRFGEDTTSREREDIHRSHHELTPIYTYAVAHYILEPKTRVVDEVGMRFHATVWPLLPRRRIYAFEIVRDEWEPRAQDAETSGKAETDDFSATYFRLVKIFHLADRTD